MSHRPQKRRRGVELKPFAATNASNFRVNTLTVGTPEGRATIPGFIQPNRNHHGQRQGSRIPTAPRLWQPGALRWLGRRDDPGLIIARKVAALAASTDDGSFDARGTLMAMEELLCDPQYVQLEPTRQVTVNSRETESERTMPSWNLARRLAVEAATSEAGRARVDRCGTKTVFNFPKLPSWWQRCSAGDPPQRRRKTEESSLTGEGRLFRNR
ncbi:hypothetical protein FOZ63_028345 [Perkinsus olseni]|uniref:Uncharacterized protein n=1 Tax=Perkinsus olseni TaxID=32597 RepID=A0A7J6TMV7_PEROL|nr:hypothetical protein FOZ63_028345 [Perkinsus olseni]